QRQAHQPDRQGQRQLFVEQVARDAGELRLAGHRLGQRASARDDAEVGVLHLEGDRATAGALFGDSLPDDVEDAVERLAQRRPARYVLEERALAAQRLAGAVGLYLPEVDPARG